MSCDIYLRAISLEMLKIPHPGMSFKITTLTHWGRVTHICVGNLTIIGSDDGLSPGRRQAITWINYWNIVNWTLRNKLQWKFNQNSNIFIHENAIESVVCEMAAILSRPQCVNVAAVSPMGQQSLPIGNIVFVEKLVPIVVVSSDTMQSLTQIRPSFPERHTAMIFPTTETN